MRGPTDSSQSNQARSPEAVPIRNALMKINMKTACKLVRALMVWFAACRYPLLVCGVSRMDL